MAGILSRLTPAQASALAERLIDLAFRLRHVGISAAPRLEAVNPEAAPTAPPAAKAKRPATSKPRGGRKAG
ncbi:MAG: hypothetical protein H0T47_18610 [Planctomycetaceae bacterium]|nr:hypothetical protein [Planctomycetaceae bacterium]